MAWNIHWQVPFYGRNGALYTAYIYDESTPDESWPITLKAAAHPFVIEEDDYEDPFTAVRLMTGYLRIVDDGYDDDGHALADGWWRDFVPATDTDRPLVLKKGNDVWFRGFLQPETYRGVLYGNPQEREFPFQSSLAILGGIQINYQQTAIQNFAYLLKTVIEAIPFHDYGVYKFSGGNYARGWLLTEIDWQNFVDEINDNGISPRCTMLEALEDMLRFWGWSASGSFNFTFTSHDDIEGGSSSHLYLAKNDLDALADRSNTSAGTVYASTIITMPTNDFSNVNNDDIFERGPSKATVCINCSVIDEIFVFCPDSFRKTMIDGGYDQSFYFEDDTETLYIADFTADQVNMTCPFITGTTVNGSASFNNMRVRDEENLNEKDNLPVIMFKATADVNFYHNTGTVLASLETVYEHIYGDGKFTITFSTFRRGWKYVSTDDNKEYGNTHMYMSFGIGKNRANAVWFNGIIWENTKRFFRVTVGNSDDKMRIESGFDALSNLRYIDAIPISLSGMPTGKIPKGKIFIDFYGSDDVESLTHLDPSTYPRYFEISEFTLNFEKAGVNTVQDSWRRKVKEPEESRTYIANNQNRNNEEWNYDGVFGSDNNMKFSKSLLIDPASGYLQSATYANGSQRPEQHLANRVANYWSNRKRLVYIEKQLPSNVAAYDHINKYLFDGSTFQILSVSYDLWESIAKWKLIEL